jgi:LysR family glycine cleavage system transcriptional activator
MDPRKLPPLSAIRAFDAAARHQSLRLGAAALGVTPSAISHQIRTLEDSVGAALFIRAGREVRLTAAGHTLAAKTGRAFDILGEAFATAKQDAAETTLHVSALPLFTQAWLIPRLGRFEAAHPGIAVAVETSSRLADFDRDPVDVAIRNSAKPAANLIARKLLDLKAVPLCSPAVAETITSPEDLSTTTLIHLSVGAQGWPEWLAHFGLAKLKPRSNLTMDTIPATIEAAARGRGVMLGLDPLIWDMTSAKTLVVPFRRKLVGAGAYYVVHRKADRTRRIVRQFVDWLSAEMQSDLKRLRKNAAQSISHAPG